MHKGIDKNDIDKDKTPLEIRNNNMKYQIFIFLAILSVKVHGQYDTCTVVKDTIFFYNINSIPPTQCPDVYINIDTSLYNYADGLHTYMILNNPTNPTGCVYDYILGQINFGDTIPVNIVHEYGFISSTCSTTTCSVSIVVIGTPKTIGQNYHCKNEITAPTAYIVDGCTGALHFYIYPIGNSCIVEQCDSTTQINPIEYDVANIYPNPTSDILIIDIEEKGILEIINLQGQIVDLKNLPEKQNNLDLSNLVSGVYTLRIKTDRGIAIRKLIKQ